MKVVTKEMVKEYLQIKSTDISKDDIIDKLINPATQKAFKKTHNYFHIPNQYVQNYQISFNSATKKINNGSSNFIESGYNGNKFTAGLFIRVRGSVLNDGVFKLSEVTASDLTVDPDDKLITEEAGQYVRISLLNITEEFQHSICEYIGYLMNKKYNEKSESIGKYSVAYRDDEEAIRSIFGSYMTVSFI